MEKSLKELREVHSSSIMIILSGYNVRIYDVDAKIVEQLSNLICKNDMLTIKYKHLINIENLLKKKKINYVILDKDCEYRIFDYYNSQNNKYNYYLNKSKKYNIFRKFLVSFYNFVFGLPFNRYK